MNELCKCGHEKKHHDQYAGCCFIFPGVINFCQCDKFEPKELEDLSYRCVTPK